MPWSARVLDGSDLSAADAARIQGPAGMSATINDAKLMNVIDHKPTNEPRLRTRLYFDPNSIAMASGDFLVIYAAYSSGDRMLARIEFGYAGGYHLRAGILNDSNRWINSSPFALSDGPHLIEIDWIKSATNTSINGALGLWIDESAVATLKNVHTDLLSVERSRLGVISPPTAGTRGIPHFDQF